jgi:hypothetical protein
MLCYLGAGEDSTKTLLEQVVETMVSESVGVRLNTMMIARFQHPT